MNSWKREINEWKESSVHDVTQEFIDQTCNRRISKAQQRMLNSRNIISFVYRVCNLHLLSLNLFCQPTSKMFSISGLMATTSTGKHRRIVRPSNSTIKSKKKKCNTKVVKHPTVCVGIGLRLQERSDSLNPYGYSCSMRCRHPMHTNKNLRTSSQGKTEDWISEDLYKRYTETDSRPISPDNFSRRSVSAPRGLSLSYDHRKCLTPEPDAKQCQFHQRRVLILDLRRVKSVDVITRQNSLTTGTSVDSTYGDDDCDNRSSSANLDSSSIFHQFSPRNLSMSRSTTPKARLKGRKKKSKERSSSPVTYERSSSPKILEGLTLPPLHSSVLTLLGQKSALKTSPRNPVSQDVPHGTTKHKKLRRHGRNKRKSDSKSKGDATKSGVVDEQQNNENVNTAQSTHENAEDEPNETQVSKMNHCTDDHSKTNNTIDANSGIANRDLLNDPSTLIHLRKPLFKILDEKLVRSKWNPDDISKTDQEIELLKNDLRKYDSKFKSASISMKEDLWLSFPRTWSRKSATFGIPTNPKILKTLEPSTYLKNYVNISEPRIHLYNLVFHRHRTIENPTGKHISFQTLKRGISEVIGRPFTDDELNDLAFQFMGLQSMNCDVDESLFRGISAFCERIYGYHALEDGTECHECSQSTTKDKTRCHLNQKSHLEKADFEFISSKIRKNEVEPSLSKLLKAICDRD